MARFLFAGVDVWIQLDTYYCFVPDVGGQRLAKAHRFLAPVIGNTGRQGWN